MKRKPDTTIVTAIEFDNLEIKYFHRSLTIRERVRHHAKGHELTLAIVDSNGKLEGIKCECCSNCCHPIGKNGKVDTLKKTIVHHNTTSYVTFVKSQKAKIKKRLSSKSLTSRVMETPLESKDKKDNKSKNIEMI